MPKVSIIIPVYNVEAYIDRCVESVLNQTYKDMEILLIVGFCKDTSLEKCIAWQKQDERIIIVSKKNSSCGDSRNYGLKIAKGKYILYVDADDFIDAHYVWKMTEPLERDDTVDITCCGFVRCHKDGSETEILPRYTGKINNKEYADYLKYIGYGVVWLRAYRRDWLIEKRIEMFDGCHEDDAMAMMMAVQTKSVFYIKEALYFYNMENGKSIMHNLQSHYEYCKALAYGIEYLKKENLYKPNRYAIRRFCMGGMQAMFKIMGNDAFFCKTVKDFMDIYFPEVLEEVSFRKQYRWEQKEKTVLFGAGAEGKRFLEEHQEVSIAYIVDNNSKLQNSYIAGHIVCGVEKVLAEKENVTVIVASRNFYYDIAKQLRENGIVNYVNMDEVKGNG